jgi:hypothetical protein
LEIGSFALGVGSPIQNENTVALMQRLPSGTRGPLVTLSAENHYVGLTTTNRTKLLLIRLLDAFKEGRQYVRYADPQVALGCN